MMGRKREWLSIVNLVLILTVIVLAFSFMPIFVKPAHAAPANCYWVGGSGDWDDDDNHWATSSGGSPGNGNLPDSSSNVYFDANAGFDTDNKTVTIAGGYDAYCKSMDWTGAPNIPIFDMNPGAGQSSDLYVSGNLTFISDMTRDFAVNLTKIYFTATSTGHTITPYGSTSANYYFTGSGGGWTLQNGLSIYVLDIQAGTVNFGSASHTMAAMTQSGGTANFDTSTVINGGYFYITGGTTDFDGSAYTTGSLQITNATVNFGTSNDSFSAITITTSTIDFESATVTVSGKVQIDSGTVDFNASSVTSSSNELEINSGTIYGGGSTLSAGTNWDMNGGSFTCETSTITTYGDFDGDGETYYNVNWNVNASETMTDSNTFTNLTITASAVPSTAVTLATDQTITGTLTMNGNNSGDRLNLFSDTFGTNRTLTAATISASYVNLRNITGAGAGSWDLSSITGGSGDCGGNSGITFTTAETDYVINAFGNFSWSDTTKWQSGEVPLPQDIGVINSSSIYAPGIVITLDQTATGGISVDSPNEYPTLQATTVNIYNSLDIEDCQWSTTTTNFYGNQAESWSGNETFTATSWYLYMNYGSLTLNSDVDVSGKVYHRGGILDLNDYDLTCSAFESNTTTFERSLVMGSGNLTLDSTSDSNKWQVAATNFSIYAEDSTIIITSTSSTGTTFTGGGLTYNDLTIEGTGNFTTTFANNNTFEDIRIDRSGNEKGIAGSVTTTLTGSLFVDTYGTTNCTITNMDFTKASGVIALDYMSISGSAAGGGATYLAGSHSYDGGSNSGWVFDDAVSPVVSASAATGVDRTEAVLNGSIDSLGSWDVEGVYIHFEYGTSIVYTDNTTEVWYATTGTKSASVTGLTFNTTYHFRVACRYNDTQYVYGDDTTFLTLGAPSVTTMAANNITTSAATIRGALTDIGDYSTVYASFEWGTTTDYGYETSEEVMTTPGTFEVSISPLAAGVTYHFKARVRYSASAYANGSDRSFTVGLGVPEGSESPMIRRAGVFNDYQEDGDLLFCAEVLVTYPPYYPSANPFEYFQFQLLDTDNTTILGATPLMQWGDRPVSIYCDNVTAASLTNQEAYILRVTDISGEGLSANQTMTLSSGDWKGGTPEALDKWCLGVALSMQGIDGTTLSDPYVRVVTGYGDMITETAGGYFSVGIPNIEMIRPDLFTSSRYGGSLPSLPHESQYNVGTSLTDRVGSTIVNDATTVGGIFNISGQQFLFFVILLTIAFCILYVVSSTRGFGWLGALILTVPIVGASAYFNIMNIALPVIVLVILASLFVRQMVFKTM